MYNVQVTCVIFLCSVFHGGTWGDSEFSVPHDKCIEKCVSTWSNITCTIYMENGESHSLSFHPYEKAIWFQKITSLHPFSYGDDA